MSVDHTRIDIDTDPTLRRMRGVATHGHTPFDVPFISEIGHNLWQGGCEDGLVLPEHIKHVVSLYPWEQYTINHLLLSEPLSVRMYDSESQGYGQVDGIAQQVNERRVTGPVLVHCQAGLNRSSLIAARAIYRDYDWFGVNNGNEIVELLREKRSPAVLCNPAFEKEVRSWM